MLPQFVSIDELLSQDMTSYEYFQSLPDEIRREILKQDVQSFEELQQLAKQLKNY